MSLGVDLKGAGPGPGLVGVGERGMGEALSGQLPRPRAFSQSAVHSLERSERGNSQALAELAQVREVGSLTSRRSGRDYPPLSLINCK